MAGEIGHWCGIDFIGGGLGAVDKIDGAALQDKEGFLVITPTVFAPFSLDVNSGAGENSPQIIAPNTNPGDKRWILTGGVFAGLTLYDSISVFHASYPNVTIDASEGTGTYPLLRFNADRPNVSTGANVVLYNNGVTPCVNLVLKRGTTDIKGSLEVYTSNTLRFTIGEDGNATFAGSVGIGGSPAQKLDVFGAIAVSGKRVAFRTAGATILGSCDVGDTSVTFRANGNDRAFLDAAGNFNVIGSFEVDDVKVVGNQGALVADATDAPSVILRLNELLARCRAHGLIAT